MDGINFALVRCSLSIMNRMKKYNEGIVGGDFMIRLAACDDERIFLDKTKKFINQYNRSQPDTRNLDCITYSSPRFLLDCVLAGEIFDIFLLDIEMEELNGLTLADEIRKKRPEAVIIFLSAHTEFFIAQECFKVGAFRYISKYTMEETLPEALSAAIEEIEKRQSQYLVLSHYTDQIRIAYDDILYVHRSMRTSEIIIKNQEPLQSRHGLNELYQKLSDSRFVYIERGCFINLDYVLCFSASEISLKTGEKLPISKNMLPNLRTSFGQFWVEE